MVIVVKTLNSSSEKNKTIRIMKDGNWFWWEYVDKAGPGHIYPTLLAALLGVYEALTELMAAEKKNKSEH